MDGKGFQVWHPRSGAIAVLSGRNSRMAAITWCGPRAVRSASEGAVSRGMARGLVAYFPVPAAAW